MVIRTQKVTREGVRGGWEHLASRLEECQHREFVSATVPGKRSPKGHRNGKGVRTSKLAAMSTLDREVVAAANVVAVAAADVAEEVAADEVADAAEDVVASAVAAVDVAVGRGVEGARRRQNITVGARRRSPSKVPESGVASPIRKSTSLERKLATRPNSRDATKGEGAVAAEADVEEAEGEAGEGVRVAAVEAEAEGEAGEGVRVAAVEAEAEEEEEVSDAAGVVAVVEDVAAGGGGRAGARAAVVGGAVEEAAKGTSAAVDAGRGVDREDVDEVSARSNDSDDVFR
ncbi:hypothetical protein Trydic_g23855 [Trypoxylus dichotomus]